MDLQTFFTQHPRAAIAFSGGVDSAYLLYAAARAGADVCAYYVQSEFQPAFERRDAQRLARDVGARMRVLQASALCAPGVRENPPERCYFCKKAIFAAIAAAAREDGYTLLLGAGSGSGVTLCAQTLLSGVNRLSAAVAMSAEDAQLGGMSAAMTLFKPEYLFVQNTQTKGKAYARMMDTAEKQGVKLVTADQGLAFTLGRATVTFIGPARKQHTDSRDDGLSLRIDYGGTSVVVMGGITSAGEKEIASSGANVKCSALIAARGGSDAGTCLELVSTAQPQIAFLTGKEPANSVRIRLQKAGVQVYAAKENGVMTLYSDGQTLTVTP